MYLLRHIPVELFNTRWAEIDEIARFAELTPNDRNMLWREQTADDYFHEWPVPISQFVRDPYYIGTNVVVRPVIEQFVNDFFDHELGRELFVFIGGIGAGKAQPLDARLPTPSGWATMGDLQVGDDVLDEQGQPARVTWTSPTWLDRPCLRVHFDDGTSVECDAEHEWVTLGLSDRKRLIEGGIGDWRDGWERGRTLDMLEVATRLEAAGGQRWHLIPTTRALDLPAADLPVDPYVLGCWLGDGIRVHGALTCADRPIVDEVERRGQPAKVRASTAHKTAPTYQLTGLAPRLREARVLGLKHVPRAYLRGSRDQRLDLLRGVMDTDGFMEREGTVAIDLCDERLARDVWELVATLGWKASCRPGSTSGPCATPGGVRHRIRFTPDECPFLLPRKAERWKPSRQAIRATGRVITDIEATGRKATRCIEVDSPRSLYLAGDGMVPTHNSFSASIALVYTLYQLSCIRDPARYLSGFEGCSLSGDAEIVLMNASGAGASQASKIVYGEIYQKVQASPYFKRHFEPYQGKGSELEFPHRIRLTPGTSQWRSALGFNMFAFAVDEAAFGIESERADYVRELFQAFNQRRRSRFGRLGWGGLFTSPGSEHSFVELIAGEGEDWDTSILVVRTSTWEAKDELKRGARVFLLDRHPDAVRLVPGYHDLIFDGFDPDTGAPICHRPPATDGVAGERVVVRNLDEDAHVAA